VAKRARATAPVHVARARPERARASQAPPRVERFTDAHGHGILVGTSLEGADLRPVAEVLAATIHRDEIEHLRVRVVTEEEVGALCGGDVRVAACYAPDLERGLPSGEMVIPYPSAETTHSLVHEYGHHLDNQLWNLGALGLCGLSNDGSRRWFFARQVADDVVNETGCGVETPWDRLLGELFAEDFVALNGLDGWVLPELPPPTPAVLRAMRDDIERPFVPRTRRVRGYVGRRGVRRIRFRLETYAWISARLTGGARAGLDLLVFRGNRRRPLLRGAPTSSRERIVGRLLPPGSYELGVVARRSSSSYRLTLALQ
jgi:hypothetical protein